MDTETTTEVVTQTPSTPVAQSTGAPVAQQASSGGETSTTGTDASVEGQLPTGPQYTPNYKFKSFDKELEFDEMFKPLVKDLETEKKLREFHEKAYGVDEMKNLNKAVKEELNGIKGSYSNLQKSVSQFSKYVQQGDFDSFFSGLQIPEDAIYKWVLDKINQQNLPPEQKAIIERERQMRQQNMMLEEQYQGQSSEYNQMKVMMRDFELKQKLDSPEIKSTVAQFDQARGQGSFRNLCIKIGMSYAAQGQDISAGQAVEEAAKLIGPIGTQTNMAPSGGMSTQAQSNPPPVIPNVNGSGGSPVRKLPRSVADLKKLAANLE
jgi:hypothetical protein